MSAAPEEPRLMQRIEERPAFHAEKVRKTRPRDLLVRFAAGALTSIVAGGATLAFGPRIGGILLAFPAILAASLTLIEEQEDSAEAREDSRGAIVGGCALGAFALAGWLAFGHLAGSVALLLATAAWVLCALVIYTVLWGR
jgi:uncharacterized membrane protein (GlpM family)